jgi:hypothetical protein
VVSEEALDPRITLMQELGQCWRGDWSGFDGRTLRSELDALADLMRQPEVSDGDVVKYRYNEGMCLTGGGHWNDYCTDDCRGANADV